ncbi:MAG: DUF456 domain-containing protein [Endomicrobia bacterium]|nr:DUF456 domain-containing protein [Endomicrobiia bacterium]
MLPGPPLALISLLLMKLYFNNMSWMWIGIFVIVVFAVTFLDYFAQVWGTKKLGGTTAGIIGTFAGLIIGFFFLPFGIIIFPFLGAFIGEMTAGASAEKSLKAATGTFLGFILGIGLKLMVCVWITVYFIFSLR